MNSGNQPDADLERRFAMQSVENRLRDLAANIMRAVRGAGRPHTILAEAQALIDAALSYREQVGHFPASEELGNALDIDTPSERLDQLSADAEAVVTARETIIHGALQVAASRLLEQRPQEAAGATELDEGIEALEAARQERRKKLTGGQLTSDPLSPHRR
jgi:hypothetical protein